MKSSFHSAHEPTRGICRKHCKSFESLREHPIGPLPKLECAKIFSSRGCSLCLSILDMYSSYALRVHRGACELSRSPPALAALTSRLNLSFSNDKEIYSSSSNRTEGPQMVALACKMVGGGNDGSLDLCARVCLIDEDEKIIFHPYVKPQVPVINSRYETTGIRADHLRNAPPLKQIQRKVQDFLCNGDALWKIRSNGGKAWVFVGHGLDHDLGSLGIEYPSILIRDTAKYPPLTKTSKLSNSLKYLTRAYLGYDIQSGIQDPYEDCLAAMRLYKKMRNQVHPCEDQPYWLEAPKSLNGKWGQRELEKMSPEQLLEISRSNYYCCCLDAKQGALEYQYC